LSSFPDKVLTDGVGWDVEVWAEVMEDWTADWPVEEVMTETGAGAGVRRMEA
jgi:hypothetical protein